MRLSIVVSAFVAVLVGFAGSVAIVLSAADAVGATPAQKATWISVLCLAQAISSAGLSTWFRMPIVTAWSTPGAAVLATVSGVSIEQAAAAFLVAALLIVATGLIPWLGRLLDRLPSEIASAMLAGVLFAFVADMVHAIPQAPALVVPLLAVFAVVRAVSASYAVLAVVILGLGLSLTLGLSDPVWQGGLAPFAPVAMQADLGVILGVALPLYLVTMASQNLPGFAVLRADGYSPPVRAPLVVTGILSALSAPFGAHTTNLAAITAAICTGPDTHPDPARRWPVGVLYGLGYLAIAGSAIGVVGLVETLPSPLIAVIAGTALLGPFMASLKTACARPALAPALVTFVVTASGIALMGIGAAFWGLVAGLAMLVVDRLVDPLLPGKRS